MLRKFDVVDKQDADNSAHINVTTNYSHCLLGDLPLSKLYSFLLFSFRVITFQGKVTYQKGDAQMIAYRYYTTHITTILWHSVRAKVDIYQQQRFCYFLSPDLSLTSCCTPVFFCFFFKYLCKLKIFQDLSKSYIIYCMLYVLAAIQGIHSKG